MVRGLVINICVPKVCIVILVNILADAYAISGQNRIEKKNILPFLFEQWRVPFFDEQMDSKIFADFKR